MHLTFQNLPEHFQTIRENTVYITGFLDMRGNAIFGFSPPPFFLEQKCPWWTSLYFLSPDEELGTGGRAKGWAKCGGSVNRYTTGVSKALCYSDIEGGLQLTGDQLSPLYVNELSVGSAAHLERHNWV